jgi:hypothetical protein
MKRKPYWEMSARELANATKRFDEPMVVDESRPLTADERARWNRVKRKRGRPKVGGGSQRVSLSIEKGLLKRVSAYAKKRRISRSGVIAKALESLLAENR